MIKHAYELDFISQINRDGIGTVPVPDEYLKSMLENPIMQRETFQLHRLSLTEDTYIAFNFNAFVVKLKTPEPLNFELSLVAKYIDSFLLINGFRRMPEYAEASFTNGKCAVSYNQEHFTITDPQGTNMYSQNLEIYWLIGNLIYRGLMDKYFNLPTEI